MTIPFGRHRLIIALDALPAVRRSPEPAAAAGASDAELIRLAGNAPRDMERHRWEAMATLQGWRSM
jgi:hypothetical protein